MMRQRTYFVAGATADLRSGAFEHAGPLERAMSGCDGAFAVATFTEGGVETEVTFTRFVAWARRQDWDDLGSSAGRSGAERALAQGAW